MDQRSYVTPDGHFKLAEATQTKLRGLPRGLRDEFGWTKIESLVAAYNDPAVDPRSDGIVGHLWIANALNRSLRQVERSVYNTRLRQELRWAYGLPASNVATLAVIRERLDLAARAVHLLPLGLTDVTPGSIR